MSALTRQKSTLFQWLAVPLWVPTGKDSVPTDSGHSVRVPTAGTARRHEGRRGQSAAGDRERHASMRANQLIAAPLCPQGPASIGLLLALTTILQLPRDRPSPPPPAAPSHSPGRPASRARDRGCPALPPIAVAPLRACAPVMPRDR